MNINTLSVEKVSHKSGGLPVALYPNKLFKGKDGKLKLLCNDNYSRYLF